MSPYFFSIIIPTFNRANLLLNTINSILEQREIQCEIIIVDDGSEDNTRELIEKFDDSRIRYIKISNGERGAARNAGLAKASGTYINYFDSDDLFNPCLFDLQNFIIQNHFPPVVYGQIENIFENLLISRDPLPFPDFKQNILYNNFLACGSVFLSKEVALNFLFSDDRRLSGTEDWELWLRIYVHYDFVEYPGTIFKQRHHPSRSLMDRNTDRIEQREISFLRLIKENKMLLNRFTASQIQLLCADRNTLIALAYGTFGRKWRSFYFLMASLKDSFLVVKRKRFWAVFKKIILR